MAASPVAQTEERVRAFMTRINQGVSRDLIIPTPVIMTDAEARRSYRVHPLVLPGSILAIIPQHLLHNYTAPRGLVTVIGQYAVVNDQPLHEGKTATGALAFEVISSKGEQSWKTAQKTTKCSREYVYAVVDLGSTLMIQCLDTGFISEECILRRVGALTKLGHCKDPHDFFDNLTQVAILSTLCKALGFLHEDGSCDYSKLTYPDKTAHIIATARKAPKEKGTSVDKKYGAKCFGRLWVHPAMLDSLVRWCNPTYETGGVMYAALLRGETISPQEVMRRALEECVPMEKVYLETALYVGVYPNIDNQCKMGISHLSCEELRDEYKRIEPGITIPFFRRIPSGDAVETAIKKRLARVRVPATTASGDHKKQYLSEVYKQTPDQMIAIIKEYDPVWNECVKNGTTAEYVAAEMGRYNPNRAQLAMRPLVTTKKTTTVTKHKQKSADGYTTTTTTVDSTEYLAPDDARVVILPNTTPSEPVVNHGTDGMPPTTIPGPAKPKPTEESDSEP